MKSLKPITITYSNIQYVSFRFAFFAIFWAGPVAQMYKLFYIAYAVCMIVTLFLAIAGKLNIGKVFRREILLFIFFIYLLISCTWASFPETTIVAWVVDSIYLFIFIMAYIMAVNNDINRLARVFESIPYAVIIFTSWAMYNFGVVRQEVYGEATQLGSSSSTMGIYLAASLPFLIWRYHRNHSLFAAVKIVVAIGMQFIFQSRATLVASFIVFMATWYSLAPQKSRVLVSLFRMTIFLSSAFVVLMIFEQGREFLQKSAERFGMGMELSFFDAESALSSHPTERVDLDRRLMWLTTYNCFIENILLGVGYMNIGQIFLDNYGWFVVSHGIISTLFGETGLIGAGIFFGILTKYFYSVSCSIAECKTREESEFPKICCCSMLCIIFVGLFHQILQDQLFYTLLAVGFGLRDRLKLGLVISGHG